MPLKEAQLRQGAHCLIINNVSAPYMEPGLLRAWKKKYDVKLVMYFLDVWDSYYARGARNLLKQVPFDQVYTFYQKDAKEHGLRYFDTYYSALPAPEKKEAGVDVFFWGTDGGRRPLIEGVANRVAELGFSGEYGICYTESSEQQMSTNPRAKFIYNEPLPYEEVIQKLMQARIILDVVGDYSGGVSLRYFESFAYGKKLISNNPLVKEMRGYQENRILYIEKPEDITEEFLREEIALTYHQEFSPVHWIEELDRS